MDEERPARTEHEHVTDEGRSRIAAQQQGARTRARRGPHGLVLVYTGNGKGKTTAALGLLARAWGRGMRVAMFQFLKAKTGNWGEIRAARRMEIEVTPLGDGFTWESADIQRDRALAREGWERCREAILGGGYDVVVLDEITYCFTYGWLPLPEVLDTLRVRPAGQHVVLTGRDAPAQLVEFADLVTEMREVKHPYREGILAQKGVDF